MRAENREVSPMVQVAETVYQSRPPLISGTEGELAMKKSREDMS